MADVLALYTRYVMKRKLFRTFAVRVEAAMYVIKEEWIYPFIATSIGDKPHR